MLVWYVVVVFENQPLVRENLKHSYEQVAAIASTPVDLAKTRLMNAGDGRAVYRGMFHCLTSTARNEGIFALYKGFFPNWFRLAPWTLMFFLSYERIRFGLSTYNVRVRRLRIFPVLTYNTQVRWMKKCKNRVGKTPLGTHNFLILIYRS